MPRTLHDLMSSTPAHLALATALLLVAATSWAGPKCTDEPQDKWLTAEQMTKKFQELGYKDDVKKLHVSKGRCWEIYGHDRNGKKVEVYFHPITGAIAELNTKD
jgi:hypothetical protein